MMQMLRRDRRGDVRPGVANELGGFRGGDMLEHDLERREVADEPRQNAIDEHRLAVEHVDIRIGHFAVDAQHHADRLHPLQRG